MSHCIRVADSEGRESSGQRIDCKQIVVGRMFFRVYGEERGERNRGRGGE